MLYNVFKGGGIGIAPGAGDANDVYIYNNVVYNGGIGRFHNKVNGFYIYNNIFYSPSIAIELYPEDIPLTDSNYNDFYNYNNFQIRPSTNYNSLSAWRS